MDEMRGCWLHREGRQAMCYLKRTPRVATCLDGVNIEMQQPNVIGRSGQALLQGLYQFLCPRLRAA
jgi:hypothetical protein